MELHLRVDIRLLSLFLVSFQTSVLVLLLRYSRINQEESYLVSTAVFLSEVFKIVLSFILLLIENGGLRETIQNDAFKELFDLGEAVKLLIPAALYVVQNNLLYLALTYLDAATYQITYQLKILTTAILSWLMLGKYLRKLQWASLLFLMVGVILVQIEDLSEITRSKGNATISKSVVSGYTEEKVTRGIIDQASWLLGIICVLFSCVSSGFSGVYFEKLVKHGKSTSLGIRNLQLGFFSIIFCFMTLLPQVKIIRHRGFFYGYTSSVWIVILLQAFGGLIVSLTVKYADNILKCFATSISIVTSTIASWLILGDRLPSVQFATGAIIVICATVLYGLCDQKHPDKRTTSPYKKE